MKANVLCFSFVLCFIFFSSALSSLRAGEVSFRSRSLTLKGETYKYALYVPEEKAPNKGWPLIIFLHGAGERGADGVKQTTVGIGPAIKAHPERFNCPVLMPQCRKGHFWSGGPMPAMVMAQLKKIMDELPVNEERISLTGLSLGGFGTWSLGKRHIKKFSALGPVCGSGDPEEAPVLSCLPVWCFHGAADNVVPAERSEMMVEALKKSGADITFTKYPGVGHNSWDKAYGTAEFISWLQENKRPPSPPLFFETLFAGNDLNAWNLRKGGAEHWKIVPKSAKRHGWIRGGILHYDGKGSHLWTKQEYRDFELKLQWRMPKPGDSGIYLRGSSKSQVNIWCNKLGSGEVWGYRTDKNMPEEVREAATPVKRMDKPVGEWNAFWIRMQGEILTVELNGFRVIDHARLPGVPEEGPIALQHHGNPLEFRDIEICPLPEGGKDLFNGKNLEGWKAVGCKPDTWTARDGVLCCTGKPTGFLRTEEAYGEPYILSGEWRLLKPGRSGLLLHTKGTERVWPHSIEVQLDHKCFGNFVKIGEVSYKGGQRLQDVEKPAGQWNSFRVVCRQGRIEVFMNGNWVSTATHCSPGKGFIALQSEGAPSEFRDLRIYKEW